MPIMANSLYRDSFNFLRNHLVSILSLTLLSALITVILNQTLLPDNEQLKTLSTTEHALSSQNNINISDIIQQMAPEQQIVLLKVSVVATLSSLAGNVFLTASLLMLINLISQGHPGSTLQAIGSAMPILPRLLLLMFISTLLTQLGLTLLIIPGVIIAVIFSLAPIILVKEKNGVLDAIKTSTKLSCSHIRLIIPVIILWMTAKLILLFLVKYLTALTPMVITLILSTINNIISALLMIYLFRLYMLLRS